MKPAPTVREHLNAQLLAGAPAGDPLAVAERLLAIQGQDPRGARLAIRARSAGVSAADIDHALSQERSMLITWVNRGTLHLIRSEDYPLLHAVTTPQLRTGSSRRLAQEGIEPKLADRALAVIERAIASDGPLTRHQLRERLQTADIPLAGQAFIHLLYAASLRGLIVRGPMAGREHAYALVRDWLPAAAPVDRDRALAELARRYLTGHGPASDRDLARWAALPLRDARAGLAAIAGELRDRRGCSARSSPCCSAGARARRSSARPSRGSSAVGSSGRSRSSTAAPSRSGESVAPGRSCSRSGGCAPPRRPR